MTLNQILNACDQALTAKETEANVCAQGSALRDKEIDRLSKEAADAKSSDNSVFKNPFVWAAVGVIFGAWAGARVTK